MEHHEEENQTTTTTGGRAAETLNSARMDTNSSEKQQQLSSFPNPMKCVNKRKLMEHIGEHDSPQLCIVLMVSDLSFVSLEVFIAF